MIDFVMNHTSSQHPWFQAAAEYLKDLPEGMEPDTEACPYVDYYHFSREKGSGYCQLAGTDWYYEAQFWSEMPDLNLESEAVRQEFDEITDFWLEKGVDGFRLDAAKEYETGSIDSNIEILSWQRCGRIWRHTHSITRAELTAALTLRLQTRTV